MLYLDDIKVEFESQGFKGTHIGISPDKDKSVLFLESLRLTQTVRCPYCGVKNMLQNKHYLGDDFYPQIIDNEIFNAAKMELSERSSRLGRNNR